MTPHTAGATGGRAEPALQDVLSAAAKGDGAAWRELIDRYGRRVFALARSRCRDDDLAEEVTQSVFATIAVKLGESGRSGTGYAERGRFEAWLFRIAMNRIRDEARKRDRRARSVEPSPDDLAAGGEDAGAGEGELERLRRALGMVSDADREVIELRHHGGLSFRQMAELLGEPVGTLLARHHRALRKIRALMDGDRSGNT